MFGDTAELVPKKSGRPDDRQECDEQVDHVGKDVVDVGVHVAKLGRNNGINRVLGKRNTPDQDHSPENVQSRAEKCFGAHASIL